MIERFYVSVVAKIGNRPHMEDMYVLCHDLGLDSALKASLYTVIDGHGGDWCAKYLLAEYVRYVRLQFREELKASEEVK
jgi:serine/threonine protein phosphatase PrpC